MDEREFATLLQLIHDRLREEGFADLSAGLLAQTALDEDRPSGHVLRHLRLLRDEWSLRSRTSVMAVMGYMNEVVRPASREVIRSPHIALGELEAGFYENESVDMMEAPDLGDVIAALDRLIGDLAEDRETWD
ncbi:MAG TPA: hypothetical protein VEV43_05030 [Actinomycetota bacterium]|nr:hypothetical protein [Actinomycetota bacterium]